MTEAWQWCFVERDAPDIVKKRAVLRFNRIQSAAGVLSADDSENFERIVPNTNTAATRAMSFHYGMGMDPDPTSKDWVAEGLPGSIGPRFTEANQRLFYSHWRDLMNDEAR